jgi:hypothetical protein
MKPELNLLSSGNVMLGSKCKIILDKMFKD